MGLVSVSEVNEARMTVQVRPQGPWRKYLSYGPRSRNPSKNYGLLDAYFRFSKPAPPKPDSTTLAVVTPTGPAAATARYLFPKNRGFATSSRFEQVRVLYRNPGAPFTLQLRADGQELGEKQTLTAADSLQVFTTEIGAPPKQLEAKFVATGAASPDVLGVSFDCRQGVAVDNVSLRGSSCTEFTKMDMAFYGQQLQAMNVKMVVLQFGVNVGAYEVSDYGYYERLLTQQLRALRRAAPNMPVLVIGISDMARKIDGVYRTRPNITKIRDAQRKAAFKTGCAFWDLFGAMGGENSMPSWVAARPALAQPDYTHFSATGARIVGELLWKALMQDYDEYAREQM